MNESHHIWMSHVTYDWVMSHMNASHVNTLHLPLCYVCKQNSHVTREWVFSHMNASCHIWTRHIWTRCIFFCAMFAYKTATSHVNESCHVWIRHVTYERVMSRINAAYLIRMSYVWTCSVYLCAIPGQERVVSFKNESRHIWISRVSYERIMSHMNKPCHIWMGHVRYELLYLTALTTYAPCLHEKGSCGLCCL